MRKFFQLLKNDHIPIYYIGLAGLFAFSILNLTAFIEYGKYFFGLSNHFVMILPSIKALLKIDFLFVVSLIFIYNYMENFISFKAASIGILCICMVGAIYYLAKTRPLAMISMLGLYGIGIFLFTSIIGLQTMLRITKKDSHKKAN